jgi:hypothetical protein
VLRVVVIGKIGNLHFPRGPREHLFVSLERGSQL